MKLLLYISIILLLFATSSVVTAFRINVLITITYTLIMILVIMNAFTNQYFLINRIGNFSVSIKATFRIILCGILMLLLKIGFEDAFASKDVYLFLIMPMLVFLLLNSQHSTTKKKLAFIILFFFVAECLLASFEFIINYNFFNEIRDFDSELVNFGFGEFRSTAFLGNPLQNALCVSIIMGFILTSTMKLYTKFFFLLIGHVALMAFNGRGALLIWAFLDPIFIISILKKEKLSPVFTLAILIFSTVVVFVLIILVENYGFGGRLVNSEIIDGSSQVRLKLEGAFDQLNGIDFLFGSSDKYISILCKPNAVGSENSFVALIFKHGVIAFSVMFCLYFLWIGAIIKSQTLFNKIIILSASILVGLTNNGLAVFTPWFIFILCSTTLNPTPDDWYIKMNRKLSKAKIKITSDN
jgi:hypothetical protein